MSVLPFVGLCIGLVLALVYVIVRCRELVEQERYETNLFRAETNALRERMESNVSYYAKTINTLKETNKQLEETNKQLIDSYTKELVATKFAHSKELTTVKAEVEKAARADALKRSTAVSHGFSSENFAPLLCGEWDHRDFRHMGDPIDYMIVAGMSEVRHGKSTVDEVVLLDIKTGKSQLNKIQRRIRDAIVDGRVVFATYNTDTKELRTWPERPESPQTKFDWED